MDLAFAAPELRAIDAMTGAEVIACSAFTGERPLRGLAGLVDWRLAGKLGRLAKEQFVSSEVGESLLLPARPRLPFDKVLLLGLGAREAFDEAAYEVAIDRLLSTLEGLRVKRAAVELPGRSAGAIECTRAVEILLARAGESPAHDAWCIVDAKEEHAKIAAKAEDERRRARRI